MQIQEYAEYLLAEGANPLEGSFFDPCAVTIVARKGPQFRSVAESLGKGGVDMLKKRDKYGWSVARDFHELLSQHVHEDVVSTDFGELPIILVDKCRPLWSECECLASALCRSMSTHITYSLVISDDVIGSCFSIFLPLFMLHMFYGENDSFSYSEDDPRRISGIHAQL